MINEQIIDQPDWTAAPAWAAWWACDMDGEAFWYERLLELEDRTWHKVKGNVALAGIANTMFINWRLALQRTE